jgi:thiol-disulfide isomerase/thioredoxin
MTLKLNLIFLLLLSQNSVCQNIKIIMNTQTGNGPFSGAAYSLILRNSDLYKFPSKSITKYIIERVSFQKEKKICEDFRQGMLSKEEFESYIPEYPLLPVLLKTNRQTKHFLDVFVGEIDANYRVIIVDKDRDADFTNDYVYKIEGNFNLKMRENKNAMKSIPTLEISYEYDNGIKPQWVKTNILINPFKTALISSIPIENELPLLIQSNQFKKGIFKLNNKDYTVAVTNNDISAEYKPERAEFLIFKPNEDDTKKNDSNLLFFKMNDKIKIENSTFILSKISSFGDTLFLTKSSDSTLYGIHTGDYVSQSLLKNWIEKDKYLLIDFWGTWCAPCIESLPELGSLYKKLNKDKIQLLSVASKSDSVKMKKIIKKYNMSWLHKSENVTVNDNGFVNTLRVTVFPTLILIAPDGQIIERKNSITEIKKKLNDLSLIKIN